MAHEFIRATDGTWQVVTMHWPNGTIRAKKDVTDQMYAAFNLELQERFGISSHSDLEHVKALKDRCDRLAADLDEERRLRAQDRQEREQAIQTQVEQLNAHFAIEIETQRKRYEASAQKLRDEVLTKVGDIQRLRIDLERTRVRMSRLCRVFDPMRPEGRQELHAILARALFDIYGGWFWWLPRHPLARRLCTLCETGFEDLSLADNQLLGELYAKMIGTLQRVFQRVDEAGTSGV